MDYEERMTAAFAALDLQKTRNYSQVAKKYGLERTTLSKRYPIRSQLDTISVLAFLARAYGGGENNLLMYFKSSHLSV